MKRGDLLVDHTMYTTVVMVLSAGPRTVDVIEECGGTTRYRRDACPYRLYEAELDYLRAFNGDAAYEASTRANLLREVTAAVEERRTGARVRRGQVIRYR